MTGNKQKNKNQGFTLFYALLVSSLALAIGASIFDITVREIQLSNTATQSQYAVYVADTGAECALYWDSNYVNAPTNNNGGSKSAFATSSADTLATATSASLYCGAIDITLTTTPSFWSTALSPGAATTTFTINGAAIASKNNQTPCATVYVVKTGNPSVTSIISHGYNTCAPGPLQLERVLQISY